MLIIFIFGWVLVIPEAVIGKHYISKNLSIAASAFVVYECSKQIWKKNLDFKIDE